ncbi:zinc-binding dehydrogenase [Conexibacter woesei]|uniref:zinc-binding dehydrogenase n=1 Tax=Conexibacter woesei TaxID=191495 RepID=UPI0003F8179F|nr:zinc-binding dehydrogenase [Conexibacter woesei]
MDAFIPTNNAETLIELARDVAEPEPAPNEAVVAARAFSINRGEVNLLSGPPRGGGWRPGADVAGVIARAAADGSGPPEGARVVAHAWQGGWAQRVAVATDAIAVLPDAVGFDVAATLGVAALTALRLVRAAPDLTGRRLLITGAAGGVGHFATELAIARGAEVVAVSRRGAPRLEAFGATVVPEVAAAPGRFDVVFESIGGASLPAAIERAAAGGTVFWLGQADNEPVALDFFETVNHPVAPVAAIVPFSYWRTGASDAADLATLAGLVARGLLHPEVGETAPWAETPRLLRALRDRELTGNAVLGLDSL